MRILVLDDKPARHALFAAAWKGHDITQAWSANEAVKALDGERFDIVTLDHDLGPASRGNGLRVARHIAQMPAERQPTRVLVHSANPVGAQAMVDALQRSNVDVARIDPPLLSALLRRAQVMLSGLKID